MKHQYLVLDDFDYNPNDKECWETALTIEGYDEKQAGEIFVKKTYDDPASCNEIILFIKNSVTMELFEINIQPEYEIVFYTMSKSIEN